MKQKAALFTMGLATLAASLQVHAGGGGVIGSSSIQTSLQRCYLDSYKMILVDVMGLAKENTGFRKRSDQDYAKGLNAAAYYAGRDNGAFDTVLVGGVPQARAVELDSPWDLLSLKIGSSITGAKLSRKLNSAVFLSLGVPHVEVFAININTAFANGLSSRIRALPTCVGAFAQSAVKK